MQLRPGRRHALEAEVDGAATLELMEAERITSVFLVPAQWQLLCADPSLASRDLSALKTMSWGAAPATTALLTRMAEAFPGGWFHSGDLVWR